MIDLVTDARGVATLTLMRGDKHNALDQGLIDALRGVCDTIAADKGIRVVILTGQGPSFCAGGDLGWMQEQMRGGDDDRRRAATSLAGMLGALNTLPKPLIGRINGNAFGGGVGLACVCDVAVADETAKFGLTETRLGLIPATIGPYVLARMGEAMARRVFMSGRIFGAEEAANLGIIARAVPQGQLEDAVASEVLPYLSCAPGAVTSAKRLARVLGPRIDPETVAMSIDALVEQWKQPEANEGITAFFERRKPYWAAESGG